VGAGVRELGLLDDRQCINVRSKRNARLVRITDPRDGCGRRLRRAWDIRDPKPIKLVADLGRGLDFLKRQFGDLVKAVAEFDRLGKEGSDEGVGGHSVLQANLGVVGCHSFGGRVKRFVPPRRR
jgi:hypothetical protein